MRNGIADTSANSVVKASGKKRAVLPRLDQELADRLVAEAREAGGVASLTGPDGLLSGLVAQLLETALGVELGDHLGYEANGRRPAGSSNARNGTTPKRVQTDVGPVDLEIPRDRDGSFDPIVVPKHARRLSGFDEQVLSLYAKGFTTGDIVEHVEEIYGSAVSKDLVSRVTDAIVGEMTQWQNRPVDTAWFLPMVANRLSSLPVCHELVRGAIIEAEARSIVQLGLDSLYLVVRDAA